MIPNQFRENRRCCLWWNRIRSICRFRGGGHGDVVRVCPSLIERRLASPRTRQSSGEVRSEKRASCKQITFLKKRRLRYETSEDNIRIFAAAFAPGEARGKISLLSRLPVPRLRTLASRPASGAGGSAQGSVAQGMAATLTLSCPHDHVGMGSTTSSFSSFRSFPCDNCCFFRENTNQKRERYTTELAQGHAMPIPQCTVITMKTIMRLESDRIGIIEVFF